jgi:hypothetical protein
MFPRPHVVSAIDQPCDVPAAASSLTAFHDLEPRLCDLVRLCEITDGLTHDWGQDSGDAVRAAHATLMTEIVLQKVVQLKTAFYAAWGE